MRETTTVTVLRLIPVRRRAGERSPPPPPPSHRPSSPTPPPRERHRPQHHRPRRLALIGLRLRIVRLAHLHLRRLNHRPRVVVAHLHRHLGRHRRTVAPARHPWRTRTLRAPTTSSLNPSTDTVCSQAVHRLNVSAPPSTRSAAGVSLTRHHRHRPQRPPFQRHVVTPHAPRPRLNFTGERARPHMRAPPPPPPHPPPPPVLFRRLFDHRSPGLFRTMGRRISHSVP